MNKLDMAHDWAMKSFLTDGFKDEAERATCAWQYADAMQAEAEKRESKERPDVLKEEWQPDWSQAPEWANWWCAAVQDGEVTGGWWSDVMPKGLPNRPDYSSYFFDSGNCELCSSFDYQGNWKESLRKRPKALCQVDWRVAPEEANVYFKDGDNEPPKWFDRNNKFIGTAPSFGFSGYVCEYRPQ